MAQPTKTRSPKSAGRFAAQKLSAAKTIHQWLVDGKKSNIKQLRKWLSNKGLPLSITSLINDSRHKTHCSCAIDELEISLSKKGKRSRYGK